MSANNLKFIFFGTPDVASKTLGILKDRGYIPELLITSPDSPSGRGLVMTETPVAIWAKENNIKCLKPEKIDEEFISKLSTFNFQLSVVVAYGKILPEALIKTPRLGTINIHYSLLPKYRGASPLEATLLNGDEETGISIQQMEYKLDSGPILKEEKLEVGINDTKEELRDRLIDLGANSLCDILPLIIKKGIVPKIQDESMATFCKKIKKEYGEIDISGNAIENWNKYRAYHGWPGTFFFTKKGERLMRIKIAEAKYENNSFIIKRVIPEGKKEMSYEEFLRWN
ncbi:TPA: methionyl-tRNA formyltransferase [Candidatus Nomurabacteria bacterium]|uniref:Methionyl-tRNA formyltransferase n=1 Tax=Candidatus Nomurabacteria bacterium GW2011_GWE1_35_16 TaxID=1618761 RepID=A0A0G0BC67_9BACT|nr:MAG: Methionyl-tRNA formyltransferase [Candidatus Nomurabacteria bacterium GW2011_GWF1_34_20]KKP63752.1 MAG: Methionyl-tRNA formyltransferase [Candidatus Nomurabacteria bacterium GW2011_GWE2_34_25]KKP66964.1 MAG: Methionyl-tRNA formyltransferase [Candidatus Nomurabacteria bacterium GW2011_GWE1_35_16]HAE36786.1 methionyl-tRNA formyltransferase [Candidatus Nomurabacteria bacterium]HAX65511.1 methionyl-tRNA formyltransferase [Candidatus Nomurabacteria bacterium]